jgi:hypothetical protein
MTPPGDTPQAASASEIRVGEDLAEAAGGAGVYLASWEVQGLQREPGPFSSCLAVSPYTHAAFRLMVIDEQYGTLRVTLTTYDRLGNYPGTSTIVLESEVALVPNGAIQLNDPAGRSYVRFFGAQISSGGSTMEAAFSAAWAARLEGTLCFSGENLFHRTFRIIRVSGAAGQEGFRFDGD